MLSDYGPIYSTGRCEDGGFVVNEVSGVPGWRAEDGVYQSQDKNCLFSGDGSASQKTVFGVKYIR